MPNTSARNPSTITRSNGECIAYYVDGEVPDSTSAGEVLWCGGLFSDMTGEKACSVADWGCASSRRVVRFDYFGHGQSSGDYANGTIGRWKEDAAFIQEKLLHGRHILAGSSMGGWISLLLAMEFPERVAGLLLLAPAPDFTEQLFRDEFSPVERKKCREHGFLHLGDPEDEDFDENYIITWRQINEAREHLLPPGILPITCPVRILHGIADDVVPWRQSLELIERIQTRDVVLTLTKDSDHRLSSPKDLRRILENLEELFQTVNGVMD